MNFVFDIDGTLSFDGKTIAPDIVLALQELSHQNTIFFASARPIRDMSEIVPKELKDSIWIGGNGAFIKQGNIIDAKTIDKETASQIVNHILEEDYNYMIDSDWNYSYRGDISTELYHHINHHLAENLSIHDLDLICKVLIFAPTQSSIDFLKSFDLSITSHGNENLVDASPKGCNKASALNELGITDYIAFGNDANDVQMFHHARFSHCIDESEFSKFASETNARNTVAQTIRKYL